MHWPRHVCASRRWAQEEGVTCCCVTLAHLSQVSLWTRASPTRTFQARPPPPRKNLLRQLKNKCSVHVNGGREGYTRTHGYILKRCTRQADKRRETHKTTGIYLLTWGGQVDAKLYMIQRPCISYASLLSLSNEWAQEENFSSPVNMLNKMSRVIIDEKQI